MNIRKLVTTENIALLLGVLGALAWVPTLWPFFQKPMLTGRVVSLTYGTSSISTLSFSERSFVVRRGVAYYPKLILCATKKGFPLARVDVRVVDNKGHAEESEVLPVSRQDVRLVDAARGITYTRLSIPADMHVLNHAVFQEGQNYAVFVPFFLQTATNYPLKEVSFTFISTSGRKQRVEMRPTDYDHLIFEDEFFEKEWQQSPRGDVLKAAPQE